MPSRRQYEITILEEINHSFRASRAQPLNLGGISGPGGRVGGPPGGYVGQVPQVYVSYDETEAATLFTPATGIAPPSGRSLLDNLNHIRYRIESLESAGPGSGSGTIVVQEWDTAPIVDPTSTITFQGLTVEDMGAGEALVSADAEILDDPDALTSGDNDDYEPTGFTSNTRVIFAYGDLDETSVITGFNGARDGRMLTIINGGDQTVSFKHYGSSTYPIDLGNNENRVLHVFESMSFVYSEELGAWATISDYKLKVREQDLSPSVYPTNIITFSGAVVTDLGGGEALVQIIGSGVGTGDVVGPISSVDDHIALFDGATGKQIKDSGVVIGNAPEGFLINGKLSPTVSSNNLTLAIKTLADADPSSTDPVYCRIGNTVRKLTSALSVTKNAGTNWFNSGGTELATQEIDYFAYLGYNATDGIVIGFSRIPYAERYGDFSTTSTNERYAAISTITNAAADDPYRVIGRFAATLSAGAGYTWTVPTYTNLNLIQRPIYETKWLTYASVVTPGSGSFSALGTVTTVYQVSNRVIYFQHDITITTNGSAGTRVGATLPFSVVHSREENYIGRETAVAGFFIGGVCQSAAQIDYFKLDITYPEGNGYQLTSNGVCRLI